MKTDRGKTVANWRKRFSAPRISMPIWARDEPLRALFTSNETGKTEIYALNVSTGVRRQVTDRSEGTNRAALMPDGETIWWWADEKGGEAGRWMSQSFNGTEGAVAIAEIPPAFSSGLALGQDTAVIGTSDRDDHRIFCQHGEELGVVYQSSSFAAVGSLSRDESLLSMIHSEHGDARSAAVRIIDLAGNRISEQWDGRGNEIRLGPWSPVSGDQRLLLTRTVSGRSLPSLWEIEHDRVVDLPIDLVGEIYVSDWYSDATAIIVLQSLRGRIEPYRYDLASGETTRLLTERGSVFGIKVRPDGEIWYAIIRSSHPEEVRSLPVDGEASRIILRPEGDSPPPGVAYRDYDVGSIHSFIAQPNGNGPFPTIFLAHGGPEAQDYDEFNAHVQAWVDHGFLVVLTNYRGSTGYGLEWQHSIVGRPGFKELEDLASVHDALVRDGLSDSGRTILSGPSWGGYLTLLGLGTQPDRWSLGISLVPMADLIQNYWDESESLRQYDRSLWGGSPDEVPDVWKETSPMTYIDNLRVPLLIVAGINDPRSPIDQINNYTKRLEELEKTCETYFYESGHGSARVDERIRQFEVMHEFATRHMR